jgi:hypothetical protein
MCASCHYNREQNNNTEVAIVSFETTVKLKYWEHIIANQITFTTK